jgi:antitoxin component YwqK of YwqJK toxin-antitoxin module
MVLLAAVLGGMGCANGRHDARIVPHRYASLADAAFAHHQDTVYYGANPYSGYAYRLSPTGDTLQLSGYVAGLEEGPQIKRYPGGALQEVRQYSAGRKNGLHTGYWDNGRKKFEFTIVDDYNEGNFKEWSPNGVLIKDFNYVHGMEAGSEKLWWNDGTIRANYVVKDGRKYGLIGLKLCRN